MAYLTQYSSSVPVIKFHIDQSLMTIGQHIDMDICVPEDGMAENHAAVEAIKRLESYSYIIKSQSDEPSLELNGETVSHAELQDGDWIIIGGVEFQFTDDGVSDIKEVQQTDPIKAVVEEAVAVANTSLSPLEIIKELKEEVESMTTESVTEDSHFSRRLRFL